MSPSRLPSPADLSHRLREWLTDLGTQYQQWREQLHADPALLWRPPLVRAALLLVAGLMLVLAARWVAVGLAPGSDHAHGAFTRPRAILRVACTSHDCTRSYSKELPLDFKSWPLVCPDCGQPSVYRAQLCQTCRIWFAQPPGAAAGCPVCAARAASQPAPQAPTSRPLDPDDAEDPW
jgi:predicted RNA-binding Zn-ribbon protein involved in translation (DUF1610 family)